MVNLRQNLALIFTTQLDSNSDRNHISAVHLQEYQTLSLDLTLEQITTMNIDNTHVLL